MQCRSNTFPRKKSHKSGGFLYTSWVHSNNAKTKNLCLRLRSSSNEDFIGKIFNTAAYIKKNNKTNFNTIFKVPGEQ